MELRREHFLNSANQNVKSEFRAGVWRVWHTYDVVEADRGVAYVYADEDSDYEEYQPLADFPGLFLKFAGLADRGEITRDTWLDWVHGYGVLGLGYRDPENASWLEDPSMCEVGGPGESFRNFNRQALRANWLLRLYESLLSQEGPDAERSRRRWEQIHGYDPGPILFNFSGTPEGRARALNVVWSEVNLQVMECYPALYAGDTGFVQGWDFYSLLGAMYLQMMYLMTAEEKEVRRCRRPECNRVVAFEQSEPPKNQGLKKNVRGKYKTRRDKVYCSDNCKGLDHYYRKKARTSQ